MGDTNWAGEAIEATSGKNQILVFLFSLAAVGVLAVVGTVLLEKTAAGSDAAGKG